MLSAREEVLLHYRSAEGGWAPPIGAVEPGEDVKSALKRELREETRLNVSIERFEGLYSDPQFQIVRPEGEAPIHFVTAVFTCRASEGELRGSSEGAAWAWFGAGSLPDSLLAYARHWLDDALEGGRPRGWSCRSPQTEMVVQTEMVGFCRSGCPHYRLPLFRPGSWAIS